MNKNRMINMLEHAIERMKEGYFGIAENNIVDVIGQINIMLGIQ